MDKIRNGKSKAPLLGEVKDPTASPWARFLRPLTAALPRVTGQPWLEDSRSTADSSPWPHLSWLYYPSKKYPWAGTSLRGIQTAGRQILAKPRSGAHISSLLHPSPGGIPENSLSMQPFCFSVISQRQSDTGSGGLGSSFGAATSCLCYRGQATNSFWAPALHL